LEETIMIEQRTIFEIHRLANDGLSVRQIAKRVGHDRATVAEYLREPQPKRPSFARPSKLDPFTGEIDSLLERDPDVKATVIMQRLAAKGFTGRLSILRAHLRKVRKRHARAFIRFESLPGEQCQVDWGHFGSLDYGATSRKLYCLAVIESHSRMLYLEFTHSQRQEALHRGLLKAFLFFGGAPKTLVHDNMLTAVIERDGPLIRFNGAFLDFLRPLKITPRPCNVRQPQEKGKVEKGAIHFIRHNFWPLRTFTGLRDVQAQADLWRDRVANVRVHATTGQRPVDRILSGTMQPLPQLTADCRDTALAKVHTDFCIHFDGNTYTVPPWLIGKTVVAKADHYRLTIYFKEKAVAEHTRSWQRRQRLELPAHREAARKHLSNHYRSAEVAALLSLGEAAKDYFERMAGANLPVRKNVQRLLYLKDEYGAHAILEAMKRAAAHNAYGAHYIENILYQQMTPQRSHPPVTLKQQELNRIRLEEPSLTDYDSFVVKKRSRNHD
jgi:transposase